MISKTVRAPFLRTTLPACLRRLPGLAMALAAAVILAPAAFPAAEPARGEDASVAAGAASNGVPRDWRSEVERDMAASEYQVTWQVRTAVAGLEAAWQAPNRAQGFRTYFTPEGARVVPRTEAAPSWQWGLSLVAYGRGGSAWPVPAASLATAGNRIDYHRGDLREWFVNSARGLEQGFVLPAPPEEIAARAGEAPLAAARPGRGGPVEPGDLIHLDLELSGNLDPVVSADGAAIDFRTGDGVFAVHYAELKVSDGAGRELPAWLEGFPLTPGRGVRIVVDARDAVYPITVDPLATSPAWVVESNQDMAWFGTSVATAGDVNGDGHSDVIVGAPYYDNGESDEGRAFVYLGSPSGLPASPSWTAESDQASAYFGRAVATAGDVNGDGYSDVIVGADAYDNVEITEGRAYVYHGSAAGLSSSPTWTGESDRNNAHFGYSVATAGDVNGDGYSDVIVGAYGYSNDQGSEGRAFVYHGSASGLAASPAWIAEGNQAGAHFSIAVGTAGDVNGDGYSDVIVGAQEYSNGQTNEGRAYVFHGTASGLSTSPAWTVESDQALAGLGNSAGTAGDVNGDGYSDVIVGSRLFDGSFTDEGRALVYLGAASGLSASAAWSAGGGQDSAYFGVSVGTAGDANGDGYADVIVGANEYDNGQTGEGRAFVYFGSSAGISPSPPWTGESNLMYYHLGDSVGTAGDVNGDGYSDVIVGATGGGTASEGRAYLYLGSGSGPASSAAWSAQSDQASAQFGWSVAAAGDVNGDGYSDVIAGARLFDNGQADEGRAFLFPGSASGLSSAPAWSAESDQAGAQFGGSVSGAGDVNGDGYSDVIVGATAFSGGQANEGRAYAYHGSAAGLSASPAWTAESNQASAGFGAAVSTAGDVNGDGFFDVIIGAPNYDNGQTNEGRASVYHGSAAGLEASPAWTAEGDQDSANLGTSVATAGDVNGDGFSDVIVGAPLYGNGQAGEGRAFIHLGSVSGIGASPVWTAESDQAGAQLGGSVATAGDVNGDGYSDVTVGAAGYDNGQVDEGRANVYLGSPAAPGSSPAWTAEINRAGARFGHAVAPAGDVNGDGYADIVVGANQGYGGAYVYLGSASGLAASPSWTSEPNHAADDHYGASVASAGDVNGDGFADIVVGAPDWENGQTDEGLAFMYYGNEGAGVVLRPRQRRSDDAAPIVQGGRSRTPGQFRLAGAGRTPFGTGRVKLEWEIKPAGAFFDGTGTSRSAVWEETGPASASFSELVSGLDPGAYHWRMRLNYDPVMSPFAQRSRWFTVPSGGWLENDLSLGAFLGGVVWHDADRDGVRDGSEPPLCGVTVRLLEAGGSVLDLRSTDGSGGYRFEVQSGVAYRLRFAVPEGWQITLQDQGADDSLDSDPNAASGETPSIGPPFDSFDVSGWSAGLVQEGPCAAPDEPVYIYSVRLDSNNWVILDFQDPNQPSQVTGYNVYRSSSASAPWPWPLVGSNVRDMDAGTANIQWVDQSEDPGTWYYLVNAFSSICNAEGPR